MLRAGNNPGDSEHAFGLALPQKIALDWRLAHEWARLLFHVDLVRVHHRRRKRDGDLVARRDLAFARIDLDPGGLGRGFLRSRFSATTLRTTRKTKIAR